MRSFTLKGRYDSIQSEKAYGALIRSKAMAVEYGEKNTKYLLQLETRNHEVKHIKILETENGTISDPVKILEAEKEFYSNLYTEKISNFDPCNPFFKKDPHKNFQPL